MPNIRQGSIHLFRFSGIDVFLHWSWFFVAAIEINNRARSYSSPVWNVLEYLALFFIVMLHEFGHALACRQVGGTANNIVLWPLGGVAYVNPPQRPGATLWSIAAGPLVNVLLAGPLFGLVLLGRSLGWSDSAPDAMRFLITVFVINGYLLAFNVLPIYPLDGGQILRSLLWFVLVRARSLVVASIIGFIGVPLLFLYAWWQSSVWLALLSLLIVSLCWRGLKQAQMLARVARLPRRPGFRCPSCETAPPIGAWWTCARCGKPFDTFETQAVCPDCGMPFAGTRCLDCGEMHGMDDWRLTPPVM